MYELYAKHVNTESACYGTYLPESWLTFCSVGISGGVFYVSTYKQSDWSYVIMGQYMRGKSSRENFHVSTEELTDNILPPVK